MSAVVQVAADCTCGTIGAQREIRMCPIHHVYWFGDKQLTAVTTVIKNTWPLKRAFEAADPITLEHAKQRGIRVDRYITEYVRSGRLRIPAGEWQEVVELVLKFVKWWQTAPRTNAQSQVTFYDEEIAGTCDLLIDGRVYGRTLLDVKCCYEVETTYSLQVGAYAELYERQFGQTIESVGIVQLAKRFDTPVWIPLDVEECKRDWQTLRAMWRMYQRRSGRP